MTATIGTPYLTVPEVAETLGISTDGVYKLIRREKLPALRLSERGVRVSRWALDAYRESLNGGPDVSLPDDTFDQEEQLSAFRDRTGMSPEDWVAGWKSDSIADSAENNALLMQALALRGQREPVAYAWIISDLAERSAPEIPRTATGTRSPRWRPPAGSTTQACSPIPNHGRGCRCATFCARGTSWGQTSGRPARTAAGTSPERAR